MVLRALLMVLAISLSCQCKPQDDQSCDYLTFDSSGAWGEGHNPPLLVLLFFFPLLLYHHSGHCSGISMDVTSHVLKLATHTDEVPGDLSRLYFFLLRPPNPAPGAPTTAPNAATASSRSLGTRSSRKIEGIPLPPSEFSFIW
ncbi:hypothetical protein BGZ63DRAFT_374566 [Mariannaea sp. PMI_226]|nr:hypothetical protein BGZ63DRAFT_374566 [Mariannaea sp. PMI_226]